MTTKIIIAVLLIAFLLVSCLPADKAVPLETIVLTSTFVPTDNPYTKYWIETSLADTPTAISTPTLPKGIIFSKVYDEKAGNEYSIISTTDRGYLITGRSDYGSCSIHKLASTGREEWKYVLGKELGEEFVGLFTCWSAKQVTNSGYVVIGTGHNEYRRSITFFLLRLNNDGTRKSVEEFRWRNGMSPRLDKEGNLYWLSMFGLYGETIETPNDGYAVAGAFLDNTLDDSMHLFRADASGNYLWERNLCQDKNVREEWERKIVCSRSNLWDAIQSQDGGFVILGVFPGIWLLKTDANGTIEWIKSYHGSDGHAVIQTSDGGFLIAGALSKDGLLIKTDSDGNLQWQKTFGENEYSVFDRITINLQDNIVVIGSKRSNTWLLSIDLDNLE